MPISHEARRNIIQTLIVENISWSGRLDDVAFLSRIYDLDNMPSKDRRFSNARGDIWQHTVNNPGDLSDDWVFADDRFDLYNCPDDRFLRFLCEMIHPVVRPDRDEALKLLDLFNSELRLEGYEIIERRSKFGNVRYEPTGILPHTIDALNQLKDLADKISSEHLQNEIARMLSSVDDDPELAIGTAKEFVETISKTILIEKGIQLSGSEDLPKLVRLAMNEAKPIGGIDVDNETRVVVRKTLGSLSTLVQCVAELRNLHGTGHGREASKKRIDTRFASLAVNSAATLALFLYQSYEKSKS